MYSTNCFQINHKPNSQHVDCVHVLVLYMTQLCDNTYKCTVRVQYVISFTSTVRTMMYKYSTSTYKVYSCTTSMINNFKQTFYNTRLYSSYMYMLQCEDVRNPSLHAGCMQLLIYSVYVNSETQYRHFRWVLQTCASITTNNQVLLSFK